MKIGLALGVLTLTSTIAAAATLAPVALTGDPSPLPGAPELIARTSDAAPGMPAGTVFKALGNPAMSDGGRLAFSAKVRALTRPRNRTGVFVYE